MPPPPGMYAPPPGGFYPPPGMMPPPQQIVVQTKRERSFTRAIFTTLAVTIFSISLGLNLYLGLTVAALSGGEAAAQQDVIVDGDAKQKVGVISVKGVIMANTFKRFDRLLQHAERDPDLKALVIEIDTPGGAVTASDQIYNRIGQFKKSMTDQGRTVPVIASIGSMGTSGGYYVACATDHIFAERTSLTANIGVLLQRFNLSKMAEKWGIEDTTIASKGSTFKSAGSMFKPEVPTETAYFQKIADDAFGVFKDVVKSGRGKRLNGSIDQLADGRALFAPDAVTAGLIDAVGSSDDAFAYAATQAGLARPHVVHFNEPASLLSAFMGDPDAKFDTALSFDGKSFKVDATTITELMTPRLMYLWRGE